VTGPVLRAVRGATTCEADTPEQINAATVELLEAILERNAISHDDIVSILFTTTVDLTSAFPAAAARTIGMGDIPLICASEIAVPGSMSKCVRVMLHVYSDLERDAIRHVYLKNAQSLRDDLPG